MTSSRIALCFLVLAIAAGCAKTTITGQQQYTGPRVARPERIIVYNFAATPEDIPPGFTPVNQYAQPTTPLTDKEIQAGRTAGAELAKALISEVQGMGLPAVAAADQPPARPGDLIIMGYFEGVDPGSTVERLVIGFGAGSTNLKTVVEGYLMTAEGLRRVGSGVVDSAGSKAPGSAIPLAVAAATGNPIGLAVTSAVKIEGEVSGRTTIEGAAKRTAKEIADQLRVQFQRQGWI